MQRIAPILHVILLSLLSSCSTSTDASSAPIIEEVLSELRTAIDDIILSDAESKNGDSLDQMADAEGVLLPDTCGVPNFNSAAGLHRFPYLQSVDTSSVRIVWTTLTNNPAVLEYRPREGARAWSSVISELEAFPVDRTGYEVDYWAHHVAISGLVEGTEYCYRLRQGNSVLASGLQLSTAWTDPTRPLRILAFGDSGNGSVEQAAVRDAFMKRDFDVFLHLGDMAYGDGTFTEFENHVFDVYQDLLHKTPTWPTIGNHEYNTSAGQPYLDVYYLPEQAPRAEELERYYSFDYGDVHMVSVDSNEAAIVLAELYGLSGEDNMLEWLKADLAGSSSLWKIAFFHHPPYSSSERGPNMLVRDQIVPVLEDAGVDLVLTGHDHHTERTKPMWRGEVASDGNSLTYVIAGAGGAGLREATGDWFTDVVNDQKHAFVSLTIDGCMLKGEAIDTEGQVIDTFTLSKCE